MIESGTKEYKYLNPYEEADFHNNTAPKDWMKGIKKCSYKDIIFFTNKK